MSDLISRSDAIEAIPDTTADMFENCRYCKLLDREQVIDILSALPSADAVSREEYEEVKEEYINTVGAILAVISAPSCLKEVNDLIEPLKVVRCKDCRYYNNDYMGEWCGRHQAPVWVKEDDFCSYGERKGGAE